VSRLVGTSNIVPMPALAGWTEAKRGAEMARVRADVARYNQYEASARLRSAHTYLMKKAREASPGGTSASRPETAEELEAVG
jgi:hypothetical protein